MKKILVTRRLLKEWKLRNICEALFFTTYSEMMRICPEIWDYPMCFPTDRVKLIHGKKLYQFCHQRAYTHYIPKVKEDYKMNGKFQMRLIKTHALPIEKTSHINCMKKM